MNRIPSRFHKLDAWRGYRIPGPAVAGCSDTGTWSDSPCPTPIAKAEIRGLQRHLRTHGIATRTRAGGSSNAFCGKRWLCVRDAGQFATARELAQDYIETNRGLRLLHDAD